MRSRRLLGGALLTCALVAGSLVAGMPAGAEPRAGTPGVDFSRTYTYDAGVLSTESRAVAGAAALAEVQDPYLEYGEGSAFVVAITSAGGGDKVTVGWEVVPARYGDWEPHLIAEHWVGGQYRESQAFVAFPGDYFLGMVLVPTPGAPQKFAVVHLLDGWRVQFNNQTLGYFPDSEWDGQFTSSKRPQWYGEVGTDEPTPCSGMGNGDFGHDPAAALVSRVKVLRVDKDSRIQYQKPKTMDKRETDPERYDVGGIDTVNNSFRYGGPQVCSTP